MDLRQIVAANIRRVRRQRHMTQEMLAETANVSVRYIGDVERARASVTILVLGRLADALKIDPAELLRSPAARAGKPVAAPDQDRG